MKNTLIVFFAIGFALIGTANATDYSKFKKHTLTAKQIEAVAVSLRQQLKDPNSLRFRSKKLRGIIGKDGIITGCAEFNAKNSYGGYGDSEVVIFFMNKNLVGGAKTMTAPPEDLGAFAESEECLESERIWSEQ